MDCAANVGFWLVWKSGLNMINNILYYMVNYVQKKEVNQNTAHSVYPLWSKPSRMNVSCDCGNGDPDTESIDINSRNIGTSRAAD